MNFWFYHPRWWISLPYIYQFLGLNSFSVYRSSFVSCLNTNMGKLLFSHIVCHHGNYIRKMLETIEIYHWLFSYKTMSHIMHASRAHTHEDCWSWTPVGFVTRDMSRSGAIPKLVASGPHRQRLYVGHANQSSPAYERQHLNRGPIPYGALAEGCTTVSNAATEKETLLPLCRRRL
jgi:hypothetical protein